MGRAVFLDRDGTINIDPGYLNNPDELIIIPGAKEGIKNLQDKGFLIFIITNQSGVGRGYFSLQQLEATHNKLLEEFSKDGIKVNSIRFCPHHPDENCDCRKPNTKLVRELIEEYRINTSKSYFVGDKLLDVRTGKNVGCRTVLIDPQSDSAVEKNNEIIPDYCAKDLYGASQWIIDDMNSNICNNSCSL